jgi:hypothetical protein
LDSYVVYLRTLSQLKWLHEVKWEDCYCRDSSVDIEIGYGLDATETGLLIPVKSMIFPSPLRSDRFWGSPSLWDGQFVRL